MMRHFTDTKERSWSIDVNVDSIEQVKRDTQFDLLTLASGETESLARLQNDEMLLVKIIYSLVEDQVKKAELTEREFFAGIAGDVFDDASEALLEGLIDFFPKHRRTLLRAAVEKVSLAQDTAIEKVLDSGVIDKAVETELRKLDEQLQRSVESLESPDQAPSP